MATTYEYPDKATAPNLEGIIADIAGSAMTDKSWDNSLNTRWDEITAILSIVLPNALDAGDKTILDGIVSDNS